MKKIIIILIGFLLVTSCSRQTGISQEETGSNCEANIIGKEQLVDLLYSKDLKGVQFIDIRTPHKYAVGHLPGAINVPMRNFFDKKYFSKIDKDAVLILYGEDPSSSLLMALMSSHFKKGNFTAALGGYDFISTKILDNYGIYSGVYDDEKPLVDFQQAVNEIRSRAGGGVSSVKSKPKAPSKPIVKRKKKEVSGGCG